MKDIAARLGVHPSTVSLSLRDAVTISPAMKDKVRATALSMGYSPDPELALFNAKRHNVRKPVSKGSIAFVSDMRSLQDLRATPETAPVHEAFVRCAKQAGYGVDNFFAGSGGLSPVQLHRILKARGISAVALCFRHAQEGYNTPVWQELHGVRIESFGTPCAWDIVTPDYALATKLALRQLRSKGHLRPGLMLGAGMPPETADLVLGGYIGEYMRVGYERHPKPFRHTGPGEFDTRAFETWLAAGAHDVLLFPSAACHRELQPLLSVLRPGMPLAVIEASVGGAGVDLRRQVVGASALMALLPLLHIGSKLAGRSCSACTFIPPRCVERPAERRKPAP